MKRNDQDRPSDEEVAAFNRAYEGSNSEVSEVARRTTELEPRITPLVVIAIIAILIGLLLPAVQ